MALGEADLQGLLAQAIRRHEMGQVADALRLYDRILAYSPADAEVHCHRANALCDLGRLGEAVTAYDRAVALDPGHADSFDFRGIALAQLGHHEEALASFDRALAIRPGNPNAIANRANILMLQERHEEALEGFRHAVALHPPFAAGHNNLGSILVRLGRAEEAVPCLERALALQPDLVDAAHNLGLALAATERYDAALAAYDRALALHPRHSAIHNDRGNALIGLNRTDEAIASYQRAIELAPANTGALRNLADALNACDRTADALACLDRLLAVDSLDVEGHVKQGLALAMLRRWDEAIVCYQRAIALDPKCMDAFNNLGVALGHLHRSREALAAYDRALALDGNSAVTLRNRGVALLEIGDVDGAAANYERAMELDPTLPHLPGILLYLALRQSAWAGFADKLATIRQGIEDGAEIMPPFAMLAVSDDPELQRRCATIFSKHMSSSPAVSARARRDRIRIGYFSADFHNHATMYLLAEAIEAHDRSAFEPIAFSFGPPVTDTWRERTETAFERFVDVGSRTDADIAALAREMEIDIAIDLKGYTQGYRAAIFAHRAAPIQASYLGYPGTMAAPFIDYLIADHVLIPPASRGGYSEAIAFLPGSYQPNCAKLPIGDRPFSRADLGLPEDAFVYCCFNQNYKILPDMFAVWMRILTRTERSLLWLWVDSGGARVNLRAEAARRGVDPDRLIFADRMANADHLRRLERADLFLDTFPCTAHTTASDALRMGLPILTCAGRSFVSRVAASLLHAVGLPELVVEDFAAYEDVAIALAADPDRLARLKADVARKVPASRLFDGTAIARDLEAAYRAMIDRHDGGLSPEDIDVAPSAAR